MTEAGEKGKALLEGSNLTTVAWGWLGDDVADLQGKSLQVEAVLVPVWGLLKAEELGPSPSFFHLPP